MSRFAYYFFDAEYALIAEFEQGEQGVLHEWPAGCSLQATAFFFS
ncbi:hypothetical protein MTY414_79030 [Mycolicibacterium mageritense]|nr:hypothetical protein MTY414_79030 [Mycolicibacterium mageritense]